MNLLYITSFIPHKNAPQAGINVSYNILETLKSTFNCDIEVIGLINKDDFRATRDDLCDLGINFEFITIDKKLKMVNIAKNINKPLISSVRYDNRMKELILSKIKSKEYDFIVLDYTQNITYIDDIINTEFTGKTIAIEHDVSFLSFERKYKQANNPIKKLFYKFEYNRLKKFELNCLKRFDYILTLNEKDALLIGDEKKVKIITPYIKRNSINKEPHDGFNIMFWGAMNRIENEDAVLNFVNNIWPMVNKENTKFYIVGSKPSEKICQLQSDNIIVTGFVENPNDYFNKMDLSVVPLRLGAGIKIKVLESLAARLPSVMTSVGAEGIGITHGKDAFVTDDYSDFAEYINILKEDKRLISEISNNGYELIKKKYSLENNKLVLKEILTK